ncbi:hypothetical protein [Halarcobacter bivalviorum]|uniref:Uncharacterized protein n=1 Tax=Halarcobacter bivalviorum TaxID=663364 RepID=A0AAX2A9Y4_9BACT|nr:hypothetical protein [Halarcobacter bivalviorum]AXH12434.1 hypothetical protein ABIV_1439 [Halarcobacter bivalviorum]RXK10640.1 hypothetical protein CRV05_05000 [Halarcobacter bivalviorum]
MAKSFKKYFSFFGILIATVSLKISSLLTSLHHLIDVSIPKIMNKLHISSLKPIKLYSTNKYNTQGKN